MRGIKTNFRSTGLLMAAFTLVGSMFVGVAPAHAAATDVWTGAAGDSKFSTASNWQGNTVPAAGDTIRFTAAPASSTTLTNDLGVTLGGVQAAQLSSWNSNTYTIDTITLGDGAVLSDDPSQTCGTPVFVNIGVVNSSGSIVDSASMANQATLHIAGNYTSNLGDINAGSGSNVDGTVIMQTPVQTGKRCSGGAYVPGISIKGFTIHSLTVQANAYAQLDSSISFPLTFGGGSGTANPRVTFNNTNSDNSPITYTVSGPMTLNSNVSFLVGKNVTVNVTGTKSGSGSVQRDPNSDPTGVLNVTGTSLTNQPKTTQLDGNNPNTDYTVVDKEVAILDGTYGNVSVNSGGTLKGLGTAARIYISEGGILAPGHSPGTITSTANLTIDGVYHVDLLDKGNYDQTVVGGDVTLNETTSTLDLNFMPGGSVTQGDTFTIIKNNGGGR